MTHLFVYGTLKQGQPRHRFLAGQKFVGAAQTQPHYRLYHLGSYPGLVHATDGLAIEGELWDVSEECLKQLDRIEGVETGLYRREVVLLAPPHDQLFAVTYLYQLDVGGLPDCGVRWGS